MHEGAAVPAQWNILAAHVLAARMQLRKGICAPCSCEGQPFGGAWAALPKFCSCACAAAAARAARLRSLPLFFFFLRAPAVESSCCSVSRLPLEPHILLKQVPQHTVSACVLAGQPSCAQSCSPFSSSSCARLLQNWHAALSCQRPWSHAADIAMCSTVESLHASSH